MKDFVNLIMSLFSYHTESSKKSSKSTPLKPNDSSVKSSVEEENGYYIWNKGEALSISQYFNTREFTCRCNFPDCKKQRISKVMIEKLDLIRKEIKQPLIVTSAFRCHKHQAFLRSAGVNTVVAQVSQHELGNAVDVVPRDQKNVRTEFLKVCEKQFDSIGLSSSFLHLDLRIGKKRRWEY